MSKKTRYLLILIGFLLFLVLAPVIVLYLKGVGFDLKTRRFVQTGIFAIRTEPKSVSVFLDGKEVLDKNGDIKFLLPKEYNLTIKKDGYFDWSKRLQVLANQVTWVSPAPNKLFMFKKDSQAKVVASDVTDYYTNGDTVVFLSGGSITVSSLSDPARSENFSLPRPASALNAAPNGQLFLLTDVVSSTLPQTALVFDSGSRQVYDLTGLFSGPVSLKFSGDSTLYALAGQILHRIDLQQKSKTPVKLKVLAFAFRENDLYYLTQNDSAVELQVSSAPDQAGTAILKNIPPFTKGDIFVNFERQALLLLDNRLYQVGSTLNELADDLSDWHFDYGQSTIVFVDNGELDYYDPFTHSTRFITRSSDSISRPLLNLALNNAFFIRNNKLESLELDTRDHQNDYSFYQGENLTKFTLNGDADTAYILDNNTLKILKIR